MSRQILMGIDKLGDIFKNAAIRKVFTVCTTRFDTSEIKDYIDSLGISYETFSDYTPNPKYEDAEKAAKLFCSGDYDAILAVGGGSSIDVAKYIKQYAKQPLIAVPTTAGSGSESTRYSVIYRNGQKQSITSESIIPQYVVLEPSVLKSLPPYQKKCTLLDALCQAIEAYWSVNSTDQSKVFSQCAITQIVKNYGRYISEDQAVYTDIMIASNKAGQAINIAQTTAAHAMSYKITSMLGLPHGHAVAICLPQVWQFMQDNINLCRDGRGADYLNKTLDSLSKLIDLQTFNNILCDLEIRSPKGVTAEQIAQLTVSVDATRLGNFPVTLSQDNLHDFYKAIMNDN